MSIFSVFLLIRWFVAYDMAGTSLCSSSNSFARLSNHAFTCSSLLRNSTAENLRYLPSLMTFFGPAKDLKNGGQGRYQLVLQASVHAAVDILP